MFQALIDDLIEVLNHDAYLSIIVDNRIKNTKFTDHEKKLYTKIIYGVCEKKLLLDYYLTPFITGKRIKPFLKNALRIGAYVIDFMNMANYYIVNELVKTVKRKDLNASKMLNAVLRNYTKGHPSLNLVKNKEKRLSLELSIPLEIFTLLNKQYPNQLEQFFENQDSYNSYRVNTIKSSVDEIKVLLDKEKITYNVEKDAIITKQSLLNSDLFKDGYLIAQDVSSMNVAWTASPKPFDRVLDVCSAPGGKSLHMAALMNNQGYILCGDLSDTKINKIAANSEKLGVKIIETRIMDATSYDYKEQFDIVLTDVPCSGLGVINHKPDLKYRITLKKIDEIINLQNKILRHAARYVKTNGILVYSTCTINKQENELLIDKFIAEDPSFKKEKELIINPSSGADGFYICKLRKEQ